MKKEYQSIKRQIESTEKQIESTEKQISEIQENLFLAEERITEIVLPSEIPLQLKSDKKNLKNQLEKKERELKDLKTQLQQLTLNQTYLDEHKSENALKIQASFFYLTNRDRQIRELNRALEKLDINSPKPIVCIIPGDDAQCYEKFVSRLWKQYLPLYFSLDKSLTPVHHYIPLPKGNIDELKSQYLTKIKELALKEIRVSMEEVNDRLFLKASLVPVLIESCFYPEVYHKDVEGWIQRLIDFWRNWPLLHARQVLIVCLTICYPTPQGCLFSLSPKLSVDQLSKSIDSVKEKNDQDDPRIIPVFLPRLEGVTQEDVIDLIRSQASSMGWPEELKDKLIKQVRDIFSWVKIHDREGRISMQELVNKMDQVGGKQRT